MALRHMIKQVTNLNYNVKVTLLFSAFISLGRGIWMGNIISLIIISLSEKSAGTGTLLPNEMLGITSGLMGLAMCLVVFPSGILTDKIGRENVIRGSAFIGIVGIVLLALSYSLFMISLALIFWGIFQGLNKPAVDSLFADSIKSGSRSGLYSALHAVEQFGMAVGPFLNVLLFLLLGDSWDFSILKTVMVWGNGLSLLGIFILFFFKDSQGIGKESETIYENTDACIQNQCIQRRRRIPIILIICNIIIGFGAGMTIKFFPVFLKEIYVLNPIAVQLIMGFTAISTGLCGLIAQKMSKQQGRIEMIIFVQFVSTICLFAIAAYPSLVLLIVLFITRGSLMNAAMPLSRSVLMDVVPCKNRGKWNSLSTIAWGLFWNVSAVLGGFLIGNNNYRLCFIITGLIYCVGTIPLFFIIPHVHREIEDKPILYKTQSIQH